MAGFVYVILCDDCTNLKEAILQVVSTSVLLTETESKDKAIQLNMARNVEHKVCGRCGGNDLSIACWKYDEHGKFVAAIPMQEMLELC
jgi:hypothetical protein